MQGAIIHLILTRSCDLAGTPCVIALCETVIPSFEMRVILDLLSKSQGCALRQQADYPKEVIQHFLSAFFNIHPTAKQTAVRRCRSRLPKR